MADPGDIWRTHYLHPTPWDASYEPLSVPDMFAASAARFADAHLIDFFGRKYSFADVAAGADRIAAGLQALGIVKGDRVGLFLPNVPHYIAAYYGALKIGAVIVNYSPLYTVDELAHQVRDSGTRLLFTLSARAMLPTALAVMEQTGLERLIVGSIAGALPPAKSLLYRWFQSSQIADRPHDPRVTSFSSLIADDRKPAPAAIDPEHDLAMLQYTGGTTGTPKGAMLTHQSITANARQMVAVDRHSGKEDRVLGVIPLFHIFGNAAVLNRTVLSGGEIVMLPRFDAAQVLSAIVRTQATLLPGVPTMYQALLDHPKLARADLGSLRLCISGGAPLAGELKAKFEAATGAILVEGYGLSESGIASVNPYEALNKNGTIGQPLPATRFAVVDRDDPSKPAPEGEPGELVIFGPQIMSGYWNRAETGDDSFVNGGLRTGDIGLIDADGFVRIVDRLKDMISVGGFKVYPSRVEAVLYRYPGVREALVIGIPDPYRGESPKGFVTLDADARADPQAIRDWANAQLGKHERLCTVEIRESLPKTLVGKLSRKELVAEERAKIASAA